MSDIQEGGVGYVKVHLELGNLFRVGMRNYARRGPERRYADFIEEIFALPAGIIDGQQAQPTLLVVDESKVYYQVVKSLPAELQIAIVEE